MNVEIYQNIISKTAVYPSSVDKFGVAYTYLGLLGESQEAMDKLHDYFLTYVYPTSVSKEDVLKELGDVYWYITAMCGELGINVANVISTTAKGIEPEEAMYDLENEFHTLPYLAESFKKFYRDGKVLEVGDITEILSRICYMMAVLIISLNSTVSAVLQTNYDKLIARRETNTLHGDGDNREEAKAQS